MAEDASSTGRRKENTDPEGTRPVERWGNEHAIRDYRARVNVKDGNPEGVPLEEWSR